MFDRLVQIRKENNLFQQDIASIMGVNRSNVSKWEKGNGFIPLKYLNQYSNHFNVSIDYLLSLSNKKNYNIVNAELDRKIIGTRIKDIRKKHNLTLREFSQILNTTPSTIYAYEIGKTLILTSFAYEICIRFNVSMDYLCGKTDGILINL